MTSVNAINGTPAMVDTYTDNQVAQRTYGFQRLHDVRLLAWRHLQSPSNGHGWAPPGWTSDGRTRTPIWTNSSHRRDGERRRGAQAYALRAGTYLNCPGTQATLSNIEQAINAGILSEGVIDSALVRIFTMRMMTGEFDPPSQVSYTQHHEERDPEPGAPGAGAAGG